MCWSVLDRPAEINLEKHACTMHQETLFDKLHPYKLGTLPSICISQEDELIYHQPMKIYDRLSLTR